MVFGKDALVAIYESGGRVVAVDWPESPVIPQKNHIYTVQSARGRAGQTAIVVVAVLEDGLRAEVQLDAAVDRPTYLGKSGGYTTRPSHAMRAFQPSDDKGAVLITAEPEPEPLTAPEARNMARRTRFERIERIRSKLTELYETLADLQNDPDFSKHKSDVKFLRSLTRKLEAQLAKEDARHLVDLQEAS